MRHPGAGPPARKIGHLGGAPPSPCLPRSQGPHIGMSVRPWARATSAVWRWLINTRRRSQGYNWSFRSSRPCRNTANLPFSERAVVPFDMAGERIPSGTVHRLPADLRKALTADSPALDAWTHITPLAATSGSAGSSPPSATKRGSGASTGPTPSWATANGGPAAGRAAVTGRRTGGKARLSFPGVRPATSCHDRANADDLTARRSRAATLAEGSLNGSSGATGPSCNDEHVAPGPYPAPAGSTERRT